MDIDISIIIVSYNTKELLKECLNSIFKSVSGLNIEIIVIDNNSTDGTRSLITSLYPGIIFLQNNLNIGFANANNQGIKIAKGRYILFLNPDTIILEKAINTMYDFLEKRPQAGVVGCSILGVDGSLQSSSGRFPNLSRTFMQSLSLDKLFTHLPGLRKYTLNIPPQHKDREVDWLTGACLMIRKIVIDKIGMLDGNYFLYFEEVDFCYRAKKAGYKVYFVSGARIIHYLAQSTKQNFRRTILEFYKSNYYYFQKNHSDKPLFLLRNIVNTGIIFRSLAWKIVNLVLHDKSNETLERLAAYRDALKIKFALRIAIDTTPLSSKAGVGHYTANLIRNLSKTSSNNKFIFLGYDQYYRGKETFILKKIFYFAKYLLWQYLFLPVNLFMRQADILHSTAYEVPLVMFNRSVVTIHDMAFWLYPDKFTRFYQLRLKFLVPVVARKADLIITDSEYSKKDIARLLKINPDKIKVVYLGVDNLAFKPIRDREALEGIRRKYQINQHRFILYVGTLEPRKNIVNLIKGFHHLKNTYHLDYKLVIVGMKGWLFNDIFEVIDQLNLKEEVIFTGYVPDQELPFLYNAADLFIYPSLYEGFGLPVLEAMSCGVPVVTSNTSSLPELVKGAAVTINPRDPKALAKAVYDVLTDQNLRNRIVEKGLLRAKDFSWEKTAEKTLEAYEEVLKRDGKEVAHRR